jgi:phage terminase large subunit GpA-like protein
MAVKISNDWLREDLAVVRFHWTCPECGNENVSELENSEGEIRIGKYQFCCMNVAECNGFQLLSIDPGPGV